jgi:hypothetical protein
MPARACQYHKVFHVVAGSWVELARTAEDKSYWCLIHSKAILSICCCC